jgi:hypothetical protein
VARVQGRDDKMRELIGGDGVVIHGEQGKGVMQQSNHAWGGSMCAIKDDDNNDNNNDDNGGERAEAGEGARTATTMATRR